MNKEIGNGRVGELIKNYLSTLSSLQVRPQVKIKILKLAIYPKLNFDLRAYDFSVTWTKNTLDSIIMDYIRGWLTLPISSCVQEITSLPLNHCGLNLPSLVEQAMSLRLSARSMLKNSNNLDIPQLWTITFCKKYST